MSSSHKAKFNLEAWTGQLGRALNEFAFRPAGYVGWLGDLGLQLSLDQYQVLLERGNFQKIAVHPDSELRVNLDPVPDRDRILGLIHSGQLRMDEVTDFERLEIQFDRRSEPTEIADILWTHPVLRRLRRDDGSNPMLAIPYAGFALSGLERWLVNATVQKGGPAVAAAVRDALEKGKRFELEAMEYTLIYGLDAGDRVDLADGASLVPYREVKDECPLSDFTKNHVMLGSLTDGGEEDVLSVVVRDLTWGPAVLADPNVNLIEAIKTNYRVPGDHHFIPDLISIATKTAFAYPSRIIHAAAWLNDVDPNYAHGWSSLISDPMSFYWRGKILELTGDQKRRVQSSVSNWRSYTGDRGPIVDAIDQIVTSLTRLGRGAVAGSIRDTVVALETMYAVDEGEMGYKLAARAACLLCNCDDERHTMLKDVRRLYGVRSSLSHSMRRRSRRGKRGTSYHDSLSWATQYGWELATRTLYRLLDVGYEPDWDWLVATGKIRASE